MTQDLQLYDSFYQIIFFVAKCTKQAKELGVSLKDVVFSRVYSSDLGRTEETVKIVLSQNRNPVPEIIWDKRLRERV